jgi:hypothetical protein
VLDSHQQNYRCEIFRKILHGAIISKYCEINFEIFALCKIFRNIAKFISKFLCSAIILEKLRNIFRNFCAVQIFRNITKYSKCICKMQKLSKCSMKFYKLSNMQNISKYINIKFKNIRVIIKYLIISQNKI